MTQDEKGNAKSTRYYFYPIGANEAYAKYESKTGWEFRDPKTGDWVALPDSKVGEKKPARYTPGKGWELYDPKTKEWLPTSEFGEEEPEASYIPGKGWGEWNQKRFEWVPIAKSASDALNPKSGAGGSTATTTSAGTSQLRSVAEAPVDQCDPLGVRWEEGEAEGWRGIWIRRGNTNEFDATFSKGGASGKRLLTISIQGKNVTAKRSEDPGTGVTYTYTGTLQADGKTVRGTYVNSLGQGPAAWWAEIKCK